MKKVTFYIPDDYSDMMTITCVGHDQKNKLRTNVALRAYNLTEKEEWTIDINIDEGSVKE